MPTYRIPLDMGGQQSKGWADGISALGDAFGNNYKEQAEAALLGQRMRTSQSQAGHYDAQTANVQQETQANTWKQAELEKIYAGVGEGLLDPQQAVNDMYRRGLLDGDAGMMNAIGNVNRTLTTMQPGATAADISRSQAGAGQDWGTTIIGTQNDMINANNQAALDRKATFDQNIVENNLAADQFEYEQTTDAQNAAREAAADTVPVIVDGEIQLVPRSRAVALGLTPAIEKSKVEGAHIAGGVTPENPLGFDTNSLEGNAWNAYNSYNNRVRNGETLSAAEWDQFISSWAILDKPTYSETDDGQGNRVVRAGPSAISRAGFKNPQELRQQQQAGAQPQGTTAAPAPQQGIDIFAQPTYPNQNPPGTVAAPQQQTQTIVQPEQVQQQPVPQQVPQQEATTDSAAEQAAVQNEQPAPAPKTNPAGTVADGGTIVQENADGSTTTTYVGQGKSVKDKQTEAQAKFGQYSSRIGPAMFNLADHMGYDYATGKRRRDASGDVAGYEPGFRQWAIDSMPDWVPKEVLSSKDINLQRTFVAQALNPLMRADSGAAIPEGEYPRYMAQYIPKWGEDSDEEIAAKLDHLAVTLMAFEEIANTEYGKGIKEQAALATKAGNHDQAMNLMNGLEGRVTEVYDRIMSEIPLRPYNESSGSSNPRMNVDGVDVEIKRRGRR